MKNENGFTLIEVLIAIGIFAITSTIFVIRQNYNVESSSFLREEKIVKDLCERVINETLASKIELKESLTMSAEVKTFEDNPDYEYSIKWDQLEIPNFMSPDGGEDGQSEAETANSGIESSLAKQVTENLKKLIWQLKVTVKNKKTNYQFSLSTWLYDNKAQVTFGAM